MWIIWGTTNRTHHLGQVADHCSVCSGISRFRVSEHYQGKHIYFIPLGWGKVVGNTCECLSCRTRLPVAIDLFATVIPARQAREMTVEELLAQTNPRLIERRQAQESLARQALADLGRDSNLAARLAMARLRECQGPAEQVAYFQDRLLDWDRLTLHEQAALFGEIEKLIAAQKEHARVVALVQSALSHAPEGAGCVPAIPFLGGCGLLTLYLGKMDPDPVLALLGFAATVVVGIVSWRALRSMTYLGWFRVRLVDPAEARGISLLQIYALLKAMQKLPQPNSHVEELLKNLHLLEQLLRKQGTLADQAGLDQST